MPTRYDGHMANSKKNNWEKITCHENFSETIVEVFEWGLPVGIPVEVQATEHGQPLLLSNINV